MFHNVVIYLNCLQFHKEDITEIYKQIIIVGSIYFKKMLPEVVQNAEHARLLEDGPAIPVSYGSRTVVLILL